MIVPFLKYRSYVCMLPLNKEVICSLVGIWILVAPWWAELELKPCRIVNYYHDFWK